jgi:hypothetical protein
MRRRIRNDYFKENRRGLAGSEGTTLRERILRETQEHRQGVPVPGWPG